MAIFWELPTEVLWSFCTEQGMYMLLRSQGAWKIKAANWTTHGTSCVLVFDKLLLLLLLLLSTDFPCHNQGAGLEVEPPGLKPTPKWNPSMCKARALSTRSLQRPNSFISDPAPFQCMWECTGCPNAWFPLLISENWEEASNWSCFNNCGHLERD